MSIAAENSGKRKMSGMLFGYIILIGMCIAAWVIFKILAPDNFGSAKDLLKYFEAGVLEATGAVGFYFVMVMGMFDFSIGATIMTSAIVGAVLGVRLGLGYPGLILGCLCCGCIIGLINGFLYVKLRIPSMIVTVGLALIYESIATYIAGDEAPRLSADLKAFGSMPWNLIVAVLTFVLAWLILNYTKIGTYTYAIGSNEFVAKNMGINVNKYKVIAFTLSGTFFGIMAMLTISYGGSMLAETNMESMGRNFPPTMGCFFGLAFRKYGIPIQAIVIGEFLFQIVYFGFVALGAPTAMKDVILGVALLIVVALTTKVAKDEIVK